MRLTFRAPEARDLPALSALCLRSKAYWGYPQSFLDACQAELTLTVDDLAAFAMHMAETAQAPVGIVAVSRQTPVAELELLFIDPAHIGTGLGAQLYRWALTQAKAAGAIDMRIEADPGARSFYEHMGAEQTGKAPSGSVPGRRLPVLHHRI